MTGLALIGAAAFTLPLVAAAVSDFRTREIANGYSLCLGAGFLALSPFLGFGLADFGLHLAAAAATLLIGFALFSLGLMGAADGKIAAAAMLWLGPALLTDFLLLTALAGGVLSLAILAFRASPLPNYLREMPVARKLHRHHTGVPYGVALAMAAIANLPHAPWMSGI